MNVTIKYFFCFAGSDGFLCETRLVVVPSLYGRAGAIESHRWIYGFGG